MFSKRKIKITNVCNWSLVFIGLFTALFTATTLFSHANFRKLQAATDKYILCQQAALELEDGSNYLTEQIRLYAITGESTYRDAYLEELYVTQRREHALETLKETFGDADAVGELESALAHSQYLTATELYAMRLTAEAVEPDQSNWPEILREIELSVQDQRLSADGKQQKAQDLVTDDEYQHTRNRILAGVTGCMAELSTQTYDIQNRAYQEFRDVYLKLVIAMFILMLCMASLCIIMRKIIVHPLTEYLQSVKEDERFPLTGAAELQELAVTIMRCSSKTRKRRTEFVIKPTMTPSPMC